MPDLNWNDDEEKENTEFPSDTWQYNEQGEDFADGTHDITKAFEDYLSLTDDYDVCWGPAEEGQPVPPGEEQYSDRIWAVYTRTEGEIYLLRSNEDLTDWEYEEELTYAPSGSRKASIAFDKNGHYEIAVEIEPAGGEREIWLFSHPYEGDDIREITEGNNPDIIKNFGTYGDTILFYQPNDEYQINYRLGSEDFDTEYVIEQTKSEREVQARESYKVFDNGVGHILLFYWRDDDYKPLKYVDDTPYLFESVEPAGSLQSINWQEILERYVELDAETVEPKGSLVGISWTEFRDIHEDIGTETVEPAGSLQTISWQEIDKINEDIGTETVEPKGSLEEILWLEP